jgi:hypothetical protein
VQPSSLVFLVIIAIWAAYFVQHWVRRREHLATARSVDRFSESMRVLEHRAALPVADLSAPQPRSYAVSPARPARAEVLVKRAGRAPEAGDAPAAAPAGAAAAAASAPTTRDASAQGSSVAPSRRARGLTLLGSLASVPLFVVLAAVGVLPWLAVLAPVVAVGVALAWVRSGVQAEQAARHAARAGRSSRDDVSAEARPTGSARPLRAQGRPATPARASRAQAPERSASASSSAPQRADAGKADPEPVVAQPLGSEPAAVRDSFYDVEAVERAAAPAGSVPTSAAVAAGPQVPVLQVPVGPLVDEDDIPLTWDPVPVPRPTYTMKAVAPRTQMPPVGRGVPPEFADAAYDEPVRRVAGA